MNEGEFPPHASEAEDDPPLASLLAEFKALDKAFETEFAHAK